MKYVCLAVVCALIAIFDAVRMVGWLDGPPPTSFGSAMVHLALGFAFLRIAHLERDQRVES